MKKITITKLNYWSLLICVCTFALTGCDEKDSPPIIENTPVLFTASKPNEAITRVSGTSWDNGDEIGIFTIKNQSALQPDNIIDNNNNLAFATNGSGLFYPKGKSIYYPEDGSSMDVIAYYPYKANLTDFTYPIDIAEQSEFFYSANLKGVNRNSTSSNLVFRRVLSKLTLYIRPQISGTSLNGLTVVADGAPTKASFSLSTATLITDESSVNKIPLPLSGNNEQQVVSALLLPTTQANRTKIQFTIGSKTYSWLVPHALDAGKAYSYNITLDKITTGVQVSGYMEVPVYTASGTAPNSAKALHMVASNSWLNSAYTSNATSIRNYTVLFDTKSRIPYWVAYPMHPMYLASGNRTDAWEYDPIIPRNTQPELYSGWSTRGIDRGHLLASADRNASRELNKTTFYFTNMAPQNSSMNGGTWAQLEERVRYWCGQTTYDTLYVVTGCILPTAPEQITYTNDNNGKPSAIPKYLYKALLRKKKSDGMYTSIAFKMENANTEIPFRNSVVSVEELEKTTGFTFFTGLPPEVSVSVKQNTSLTEWD